MHTHTHTCVDTGADDKPVSILACGHAYCNTCLLQVTNGTPWGLAL